MRFPKTSTCGESLMMEDERKAYKDPPATDWYPGDVPPVKNRVGYYVVRNNPDSVQKRLKFTRLNASFRRWWDGKRWLTWKDGDPSVMGSPHHQWCGLTEKVI